MKLGTLQKEWIKSLRENPTRQGKNILGRKTIGEEYKACCLGELLIVNCRLKNRPVPFSPNDTLLDMSSNGGTSFYLSNSYSEFGLIDGGGAIHGGWDYNSPTQQRTFTSLSQANDNDVSWKEIADFIEANPEKIFKKSV